MKILVEDFLQKIDLYFKDKSQKDTYLIYFMVFSIFFSSSYFLLWDIAEKNFKTVKEKIIYIQSQIDNDKRYLELNPVRAGMVTDPGKYRWSSYQTNALGELSDLCTPHPEYLSLGVKPLERQENYCSLFADKLDNEFLEDIRINTHKGMAVGHERFKKELEVLTGRRLKAKRRGRPVGWRKKKI